MKATLKYFLISIAAFAKEKVSVEFGGDHIIFDPPEKVVISPSFFKEFVCVQCGICCKKGISPLVYSNSDVRAMKAKSDNILNKLYGGLRKITISINGLDQDLWLYEFEGYKCGFDELMEGDDVWGCKLHFTGLKPLNCNLPWVRIGKSKGVARLSKRPFGYGWAFGCQGVWGKDFDSEQFLGHDLDIIRKLIKSSQDLGINTYWPEVLNELESWHAKYNFGDVGLPQKDIVLFDSKRNFVGNFEKTFF